VICEHHAGGGACAQGLAEAVLQSISKNRRRKLRFAYPLNLPLEQKIDRVARQLYGADGVDLERSAETDLELITRHGYQQLPICIAKTPLSLSDVASRKGRPSKFRITVNELRLAAGAGFVVVICGNIVTMPGLPKVPAAAKIQVLPNGKAIGLA